MITVNRLWMLGAVIVAIGLAALGYFFGVSPQLSARATAASTLASVQTSNTALAAKVGTLAGESRDLGTLRSHYDALNTALPDSSATSGFVSQLGSAATSSGVTLSNLTISDAAPYAAPVAAAAPAPTSSSAATPAPQPTAPAGMPPFTSSEVTGSTLAVIPVTVNATGSYANALRFVKAVQNLQRYVLVTGITTSPASGSGVTVSITGEIFAITGQGGPAAAATPAATPAPTPR